MNAHDITRYLGCKAWFANGVLEIRDRSDAHLSVANRREVILSLEGFARELARQTGQPTDITVPLGAIAIVRDVRSSGSSPSRVSRTPEGSDDVAEILAVLGPVLGFLGTVVAALVLWKSCAG